MCSRATASPHASSPQCRTRSRLTAAAIVPAAANLLALNSSRRLRELLIRGTRYTLALSLPVTIAALVLARPLLIAWVGPRSTRTMPVRRNSFSRINSSHARPQSRARCWSAWAACVGDGIRDHRGLHQSDRLDRSGKTTWGLGGHHRNTGRIRHQRAALHPPDPAGIVDELSASSCAERSCRSCRGRRCSPWSSH